MPNGNIIGMIIRIKKIKCKRKSCGHEWVPRQADVRICPKCKSALFDK